MLHKKCNGCQEMKPIKDFRHWKSKGKQYIRGKCRPCELDDKIFWYYTISKDKYAIIKDGQDKRRRDRQRLVSELLGDKCFFDDEFCNGPIQNGHKNPGFPHGKWSDDFYVLKYPDAFWRQCHRHNLMQFDLPKEKWEQSMVNILTKLGYTVTKDPQTNLSQPQQIVPRTSRL